MDCKRSSPWKEAPLAKFSKFCRACSGTVAVEFALLAPVLLLMIYGIIETGRGVWVQNAMQLAVEEAARYAMANPDATNAAIITEGRDMLAGLNAGDFTFTVTTEAGTGISYITVTATHQFNLMFPMPDVDGTTTRLLSLSAFSRQPRID